jgi:hypothetical protein
MQTYLSKDAVTNIEVAVEYITPAQASEYMSNNYHYNRKVADPKVKELATEMRMSRFYLGDSAICFNEDGALINGQHRLSALIKSNTTQPFIVARNMPKESLKIMDIGAKRDTADRITLSGISINRREQAVIKNCMTPFNSSTNIGVQIYNHNRYDAEIADNFVKTKYFFDCCEQNRILSSGHRYKTFIVCGALKIFLQMKMDRKDHEYIHGMSAIDRAFHFMHVTCDQMAVKHAINNEYDKSGLALKQKMEQYRENSPGALWCTPDCYRKTMNLAHSFMLGTPISVVKTVKHDKFSDFSTLVQRYCVST